MTNNAISPVVLSRMEKDLVTVSKKLGFLFRENDAFYKYRWIVADYLGVMEHDVSNKLLLKKLGKTFNTLIHGGYIELPTNYKSIEELYFDLLINHKNLEDILNYFIAGIQWIDISDSNFEILINSELFNKGL